MRVSKQLSTIVIAAAVAGVVSFGAGAVVEASATGSSVTYQACVSKTGAMSKVGTLTPTCPATSHVISWNQQGVQGLTGDTGPQGPGGPVCLDIPPAPAVANWSGCYLTNADFQGPSLTASLTAPNLTGANLTNITLISANLTNITLISANLHGATLTGANLTGGNLLYAYLQDATLIGATLINATLIGANLTGADLTGANLTGASLDRLNIIGVTWQNTTCPDGTNSRTSSPQTCVDHGM